MSTPSSLFRSLLYLALLAFLSCGKEKISLTWEELDSGVFSNLSGVHFTSPDTGYAVGGDTWLLGLTLQTNDGGQNWQVDSFSNKQLFGLDFTPDGLGLTVGIDGYLFEKPQTATSWKFHRLPRWKILRDAAFSSTGESTVVGGEAFDYGILMTLNANYGTITTDTFANQLNAVCYSDALTAHAVGYGIILRTTDGGREWVLGEETGDFFRSVHFPSSTTGYVVGYNGSILKSTDAGLTWESLRSGDAIGVKDIPFQVVHFTSEDRGYIAGDGGVLWRTENGGEDWQVVKGLPDINFQDIHIIDQVGYLVGDDGRILRFEE